jgi:hypothetical protein
LFAPRAAIEARRRLMGLRLDEVNEKRAIRPALSLWRDPPGDHADANDVYIGRDLVTTSPMAMMGR